MTLPQTRHRAPVLIGGALLSAFALTAGIAVGPALADTTEPPSTIGVTEGLIDTTDLNALGLPQAENAETVTVFEPGDDDAKFNHGTVLMPFKDRLYAQWQSSALDEDAPETIVTYSVSDNGTEWSAPIPLTEPRDDGYTSNGGWWTDGETLIAYLNVWPAALEPRGGYTEYVSSTDGVTWSEPQRVTDEAGDPVLGIIEQDVKALPSGRLLTAFHVQPGLHVKPYYTDDPTGVSGWTQGEFENQPYLENEMSRELEPSWHVAADGSIFMTFRDQGGSTMFKLASKSEDNGETWSQAVVTNVPDSRTKQSAGNLPDGTAYLTGSLTGTKTRYPLVIVLSADGVTFDQGFVIRDSADLQPKRYEGKSKNPGYSYQKSIVWGDSLYVSYGTNKEDVEFSRIPLADLELGATPSVIPTPTAPETAAPTTTPTDAPVVPVPTDGEATVSPTATASATSAPVTTSAPSPTGDAAAGGSDALATTGGEVPWLGAASALGLVLLGAAALLLRRRKATSGE